MKDLIKQIKDTETKLEDLRAQFDKPLYDLYVRYKKDFNIKEGTDWIESYTIDDDAIGLQFEHSYCGCCPPEIEFIKIDLGFFEDYEAAKAKKIADDARREHLVELEKIKVELEKIKREKTLEELREKKERKEFERLREKYEKTETP